MLPQLTNPPPNTLIAGTYLLKRTHMVYPSLGMYFILEWLRWLCCHCVRLVWHIQS